MTAPITKEQIDELERLEAEATKGPWGRDAYTGDQLGEDYDEPVVVIDRERGLFASQGHPQTGAMMCEMDANAGLIAALRNLAPALIQVAREHVDCRHEFNVMIESLHDMSAENDRLKELLRRASVMRWDPDTYRCNGCGEKWPDHMGSVCPNKCEIAKALEEK